MSLSASWGRSSLGTSAPYGDVENGRRPCHRLHNRFETGGTDTADRPLFSGINRSGGLPDGVINIVPGFGETAGEALTNHDDVDKLAFTGSTEIGKKIMEKAAKKLNA